MFGRQRRGDHDSLKLGPGSDLKFGKTTGSCDSSMQRTFATPHGWAFFEDRKKKILAMANSAWEIIMKLSCRSSERSAALTAVAGTTRQTAFKISRELPSRWWCCPVIDVLDIQIALAWLLLGIIGPSVRCQ